MTDNFLDSIGLVDLVLALVSAYGIEISDLEMTQENFDSAETILQLLREKSEVRFKK